MVRYLAPTAAGKYQFERPGAWGYEWFTIGSIPSDEFPNNSSKPWKSNKSASYGCFLG
jgi:hypothetical protein